MGFGEKMASTAEKRVEKGKKRLGLRKNKEKRERKVQESTTGEMEALEKQTRLLEQKKETDALKEEVTQTRMQPSGQGGTGSSQQNTKNHEHVHQIFAQTGLTVTDFEDDLDSFLDSLELLKNKLGTRCPSLQDVARILKSNRLLRQRKAEEATGEAVSTISCAEELQRACTQSVFLTIPVEKKIASAEECGKYFIENIQQIIYCLEHLSDLDADQAQACKEWIQKLLSEGFKEIIFEIYEITYDEQTGMMHVRGMDAAGQKKVFSFQIPQEWKQYTQKN